MAHPDLGNQQDRIEGKVDQILDRLTRMEERQNSHAGKLEAHDTQLAEHGKRIRDVELQHAVNVATTKQEGKRLLGRWGALFSVFLVVLGAIGTLVANAIIGLMKGIP
ncbi:hypothetical protein [Halomonas sp. WWR20]